VSSKGWTATELLVVDQDERLWTVGEAAQLLGPPVLDPVQVRQLVVMWQIKPVGVRSRTGAEKRGRQPRVYRAIDLIRAYDALSKAA
jgi:hypothetical protein